MQVILGTFQPQAGPGFVATNDYLPVICHPFLMNFVQLLK